MRSKFKTVKDLLIGNMVIESRQLVNYGTLMGGRGELNPQPAAPQAAALPLSYDLRNKFKNQKQKSKSILFFNFNFLT